MTRGNLFADVPQTLAEERFDTLAEGTGERIERIVSTGQATPAGEWYDQAWDEWVVLLQGEAELRFEDGPETTTLAPGDWLLIPAHQRHRVERTSTTPPAVWLAVHLAAG
ncbi:cupin domain-containing protein [Arhodomonas sp. KWT2]|uniref:cupin domain-containing protein n=1 Tax=unclassified Arhodomonas TaxID=2621637 RepID=UPI0013D4B2B9|nr:cupin domain-containing protein [Arhodomonas sp. KWT]